VRDPVDDTERDMLTLIEIVPDVDGHDETVTEPVADTVFVTLDVRQRDDVGVVVGLSEPERDGDAVVDVVVDAHGEALVEYVTLAVVHSVLDCDGV